MRKINVKEEKIKTLIIARKRGDLIINKDYQRNQVWKLKMKKKFIQSLIKDYPVGMLIVFKIENNSDDADISEIIDGQQRWTTILDFITNKFKVKLEESKPEMWFSEWPNEKQTEFKKITLIIQTFEGKKEEITNIFTALNENVEKLTSDEIDHAKYTGALVRFSTKIALEYKSNFIRYNIISEIKANRFGIESLIYQLIYKLLLWWEQKDCMSSKAIYNKKILPEMMNKYHDFKDKDKWNDINKELHSRLGKIFGIFLNVKRQKNINAQNEWYSKTRFIILFCIIEEYKKHADIKEWSKLLIEFSNIQNRLENKENLSSTTSAGTILKIYNEIKEFIDIKW